MHAGTDVCPMVLSILRSSFYFLFIFSPGACGETSLIGWFVVRCYVFTPYGLRGSDVIAAREKR